MNIPRNLAAFSAFALVTGSASAANVIVNGDFETGNLSGWTQNGTGTTVSATNPLAGTSSAVQVQGTGAQLFQSFTAITSTVTTSFIFSATDPGELDRSMNVGWRGTGYPDTSGQINLRLVDVGDNGIGDIQVFDSATWQTVLTDVVTFDSTPSLPSTTLSLTINSFGLGANYDLTVGASTATGITFFHGAALTDLEQLSFVNSSLAAGSSVKFDNVSVDAIPEPSAALLGSLGLLMLLRRRRN